MNLQSQPKSRLLTGLSVALCATALIWAVLAWACTEPVQATDYLDGIVNINPGAGSSYPSYLTVYQGDLYFQADDGTHGNELWTFDGTDATLVADIQAGSAAGDLRDLIVYDGILYFSAVDGVHGRELWAYDAVTTALVHDINPGSADGAPSNPIVYGGDLYFTANDGIDGSELWRYDGVTVTQVADLDPGVSNLGPSHLFVYDGVLVFRANDGVHGHELWTYDGVTTTLVSDIYTGTGSSYPGPFAVYEGDLFFGAQDANYQYHLYRYDGSDVTQVGPGTYHSAGPENLTVYDGALYFTASGDTYGYEIWRYDGDVPERVTDINPDGGSASPNYLTVFAGKLYFYAYDPTYGYELWSYYDDAPHFELNINTLVGTASSYPSEFTPLGDRLYFRADEGYVGQELMWITPTPQLQVEKRVSNLTPEGGEAFTYTIVVEHPGGKPLTGVVLSDMLPVGLSFVGPVTLEPNQPGAVLATSPADLPVIAGNLELHTGMRVTATLPVRVDALVPPGTPITNTVNVTSNEAPSRTAACGLTVIGASCSPIADVDLTASADGELTAGATVRFLADVQGGSRPVVYAWTLDGTPVTAAGEVYEHAFTETGTYAVAVTASNICSTDEATTAVTVLPATSDRPDLTASQLWVSRSTAQAGDVLTYTLLLRNQSAVTVTATVTNRRPAPLYASVVPNSAHASDGGVLTFEEDYWTWHGDVVSGTPVLLTYAVTVGSPSDGTLLENLAHVDDGAGRTVQLTADTMVTPDFGLLIDEGAPYTNIPTVTLTYAWSATAAITEANLGSCSGSVCKNSGWLALPTTVYTATYAPWTLDVAGDQHLLYTAWVLYRNGAGETVGPFYDTILYDPQVPEITNIEVIPMTGAMNAPTNADAVTVRVTTRDANTGVDRLHVSDSADFVTFTVVPVSGPTTDVAWSLADGDEVYVRAVDRAGNFSPPVIRTHTVEYAIWLPFVVGQAP